MKTEALTTASITPEQIEVWYDLSTFELARLAGTGAPEDSLESAGPCSCLQCVTNWRAPLTTSGKST